MQDSEASAAAAGADSSSSPAQTATAAVAAAAAAAAAAVAAVSSGQTLSPPAAAGSPNATNAAAPGSPSAHPPATDEAGGGDPADTTILTSFPPPRDPSPPPYVPPTNHPRPLRAAKRGGTGLNVKQRNNRAYKPAQAPEMFIKPELDTRPPSQAFTHHANHLAHAAFLDTYTQGQFAVKEREAIDAAVKAYLEEAGIPFVDLPKLIRRKTTRETAHTTPEDNPYKHSRFNNWIKQVHHRSRVNRTLLQLHIYLKRAYASEIAEDPLPGDGPGPSGRRKRWKPDEDAKLRQLVAIHGPRWEEIDREMGRESRLRFRMLESLDKHGTAKSARWSAEEKATLVNTIEQVMRDEGYSSPLEVSVWHDIAAKLPGRVPHACSQFFMHNFLELWGAHRGDPAKERRKWNIDNEKWMLTRVVELFPNAERELDIDWSVVQGDEYAGVPPQFFGWRLNNAIRRIPAERRSQLSYIDRVREAAGILPERLAGAGASAPSIRPWTQGDERELLSLIENLHGSASDESEIPWSSFVTMKPEWSCYKPEFFQARVQEARARVPSVEDYGFMESINLAVGHIPSAIDVQWSEATHEHIPQQHVPLHQPASGAHRFYKSAETVEDDSDQDGEASDEEEEVNDQETGLLAQSLMAISQQQQQQQHPQQHETLPHEALPPTPPAAVVEQMVSKKKRKNKVHHPAPPAGMGAVPAASLAEGLAQLLVLQQQQQHVIQMQQQRLHQQQQQQQHSYFHHHHAQQHLQHQQHPHDSAPMLQQHLQHQQQQPTYHMPIAPAPMEIPVAPPAVSAVNDKPSKKLKRSAEDSVSPDGSVTAQDDSSDVKKKKNKKNRSPDNQ
ncbi:hypothetical protein HDU87_008796 [Geranomyces variabilis]|uniref:Myb-like domain-containing protein n=1 Tax=Geranomyces variabilis TaxID=109894 RepID=A0AAD5THW7_9FUNG|nr:hypothetical protein HDU87_008796 [Geranomyces variabilis]